VAEKIVRVCGARVLEKTHKKRRSRGVSYKGGCGGGRTVAPARGQEPDCSEWAEKASRRRGRRRRGGTVNAVDACSVIVRGLRETLGWGPGEPRQQNRCAASPRPHRMRRG